MATDFDIRPVAQQRSRLPATPLRVATGQKRSKQALAASGTASTPHGGIITASSKRRHTGNPGKRWLGWIDIALTAIVAVVLVLFSDTAVVTGTCIALYAIYIGVRRVGGRLPFALALLAILGVVVHFTVIPDPELVNTFAMYAFFLLVIGTIALALELPHKV